MVKSFDQIQMAGISREYFNTSILTSQINHSLKGFINKLSQGEISCGRYSLEILQEEKIKWDLASSSKHIKVSISKIME